MGNSSPIEFMGTLVIQLACHSIYMSVCVLLSLRLFTVCLVKRQPNRSAADRLEGLPPEPGGAALAAVCWREVFALPAGMCSFSSRCSGWLQLQGEKHLGLNHPSEKLH